MRVVNVERDNPPKMRDYLGLFGTVVDVDASVLVQFADGYAWFFTAARDIELVPW